MVDKSASEIAMGFVESLLKDKSPEEQIKILRSCMGHAITHPWVDDDQVESICENIASEFEVDSPFSD